jgi:hypothetical protein
MVKGIEMKTYNETIAHFATAQANSYADYLMSDEDDEDIRPWLSFEPNTVKIISYCYDTNIYYVYADLKRYTLDNFGNLSNERFEVWYNTYKDSKK